ncbi:WD40 repeat domain-containing protein [Thalassotalea sp. PLHSN55]|uniref:WD40 repeat domain-containing protein n=1 Tax=Thalassotalea sp. PLHSN55 TaxID=3435888 RepID=UPI003F82D610
MRVGKSTFLTLFAVASLLLLSACQPSGQQPLQKWQHAIEGAYAADIANDGKLSASSSIHHGISLWDLEKNALLFQWSQQQDSADNLVLAIDIADNNSHVLTASRENFALWNATSGQSEGYWRVRESSIRDIAVANDGRFILIGKGNGTVVHVTPATGRRLEFLGHSEKINSVDMLPNGRIALSGGNDFVAYLWDTQSGQVIYRFNHPSRVTKVALDHHGRYAFTADSKKQAHIWDLKTGKLVSSLKYTNRQEVFSSVQFSKDGQLLVTGAPTRKVSVWDISSGERRSSFRVSPRDDIRPAGAVVYSVAFRDNSHILTQSSSGYAELWQINQ